MNSVTDIESHRPFATDGKIAAINLESARRRAWARFTQDARLPGAAEALVDMERLVMQFLGDLHALDRLKSIAAQFARADDSFRVALIHAEIASILHRFEDARDNLARAAKMGAPGEAIERQLLTINQACGANLDAVLATRRRVAAQSGQLEDLVPLGAVFADLECHVEAEATYHQAFCAHEGTSPFPLGWVCFQLGVLWGETVREPDLDRAAHWYRRAITFLPAYVKARVHLAEIHTAQGQCDEAEALLAPVASSCDPEVGWRLADALSAQGRFEEAEKNLNVARCCFDDLLSKHPLAFADHAAEFYAGSGNNHKRALEFARVNAANRPTRRAVQQVSEIAKMRSCG